MIPSVLRQILVHRHRLALLAVLALSTLVSLGLILARWIISGRAAYAFLVWNLFLAWIPFWLAGGVYLAHRRGTHRARLLLSVGIVWLLFFPNAPYLLTDFVHLRPGNDGPWWCDLVLTFGFAWNGLLLGLVSLYMMHRVAEERLGVLRGWAVVAGVLLLGSFGISLGRFQRFNSWDVLTRPLTLMSGISDQLFHPFSYPREFAMAGLLCAFLALAYLTLLALMALSREEPAMRFGANAFDWDEGSRTGSRPVVWRRARRISF